jgi:phage terminase small subunit
MIGEAAGDPPAGLFFWKGAAVVAKLTDRQRRFVDEYLVDLNATQAAIRAGYSPRTARQIGDENLSKPYLSDEISRALAERSRRTGVNQDRVLLEMARIGFANIADVAALAEGAVLADVSEDDMAAVQSVRVRRVPTENGEIVEREVRMYDKTKALIELGRHLGLFDARVRVSGAVPVVIRDDLGDGG